jgi:hypothetical protein
MKDLLQTLDDILKLDFKQDTESGSYILKEPENPVGYPITIIKKKGKALSYKFDTKKVDIFPLFKKEVAFLTQICDYIIFYPFEQKMFVFLCELKTNNITGSSKQLQASEILAHYIVKMAIKYLNFKSFDVEYRALVFSTSNTIRFATHVKKEAYLEYPSGLKHKHLRAGEDCQLDHHCY